MIMTPFSLPLLAYWGQEGKDLQKKILGRIRKAGGQSTGDPAWLLRSFVWDHSVVTVNGHELGNPVQQTSRGTCPRNIFPMLTKIPKGTNAK